jgi:hypothetical protein
MLHGHSGKDFGEIGMRRVIRLAKPSADDAFARPIAHGDCSLSLYPVSADGLLGELNAGRADHLHASA